MSNNYDLKRIQEIELEILDEVIRICDKNNIKYNLEGGSMIGAIRHNGMIPWDDDIDLAMMRGEYTKFVEACKTDLDSSRFVFQDCHTDKRCGFIFGKIRRKNTILSENYSYHLPFEQGVWVDIFVYDYVSNDENVRAKDRKRMKFIQNMYIIRCGYKFPEDKSRVFKFAYHLIKPFTYLFSYDFYIKKMDREMNKYNENPTNYVFNYAGAYPDRGLFSKDMFKELVSHEFDGRECNVVKEYDAYLKQIYGDYMKLPPVEKRNGGAHHVHEFKDLR